MLFSVADYVRQLLALLPKGPAWELTLENPVTSKFSEAFGNMLAAWADEFARIQLAAVGLLAEADPRTTDQLLSDYERVFGLPSDCTKTLTLTKPQRRAALVAQMTATGGQSKAYFIELASTAGFEITITEFTAFTVNSKVSDTLIDDSMSYVFVVNAPDAELTYNNVFRVNSQVSDALSSSGNQSLECLINRFKPAHTIARFNYA